MDIPSKRQPLTKARLKRFDLAFGKPTAMFEGHEGQVKEFILRDDHLMIIFNWVTNGNDMLEQKEYEFPNPMVDSISEDKIQNEDILKIYCGDGGIIKITHCIAVVYLVTKTMNEILRRMRSNKPFIQTGQ